MVFSHTHEEQSPLRKSLVIKWRFSLSQYSGPVRFQWLASYGPNKDVEWNRNKFTSKTITLPSSGKLDQPLVCNGTLPPAAPSVFLWSEIMADDSSPHTHIVFYWKGYPKTVTFKHTKNEQLPEKVCMCVCVCVYITHLVVSLPYSS